MPLLDEEGPNVMLFEQGGVLPDFHNEVTE
jgi:hypothetical protein